MASFKYYGKEDKDIEQLIKMINDLDSSHKLSVFIESETCFTKSIPKQLLKALHNKLIKRFKISNRYLNENQSKVILDFLNSPEVDYNSFGE